MKVMIKCITMGYCRFLLSIYIVISYKRPRIPADSIVPKKSTDGDGSKKIRGLPRMRRPCPSLVVVLQRAAEHLCLFPTCFHAFTRSPRSYIKP